MLHGKIAVVTGASRGIGKAIAKTFARNGATVVVNYQGSAEKAAAVVTEIEADGGNAIAMQCSVNEFTACEAWMKEVIQKFGRIDILVNNAGITRDNLMMRMSEEDFNAVIDTNLKGTFHCMKLASRQMLKQKSGCIINMASVVGLLGNAGQVNYSASKAGVIGMTKSAARELASRGITVNAIAPGFIETDMTEVLPEAVKEAMVKQIPLGHIGSVEDIADAALFLASGHSKYITGQVLSVDGGMAM